MITWTVFHLLVIPTPPFPELGGIEGNPNPRETMGGKRAMCAGAQVTYTRADGGVSTRIIFRYPVDSAKVFTQLSAPGNFLSPDGQNMNVALEVSLQIRPDVRPDATAGTVHRVHG